MQDTTAGNGSEVPIDEAVLKNLVRQRVRNGQVRYVLLIRHASREIAYTLREENHMMAHKRFAHRETESNFKTPGLPRTLAMAGRVADALENLSETDVKVEKIMCSRHTVARQTAEEIRQVLHIREVCEADEINPRTALTPPFAQVDDKEIHDRRFWTALLQGSEGKAVAAVGHQPHLTRVAKHILGRELPADVLPLANSEIACICIGTKPKLLWLLTNKPESLLNDLRDKIKSKYDVAKFFLGALVVKDGLVLNANLWTAGDKWGAEFLYLGLFCSIAGLVLAVATLLAYDSLLMPPDFWGAAATHKKTPWSVDRPPSQAQLIIFYEMIHVWKWFFMPSLAFALASIVCFLLVLAGAKHFDFNLVIVGIASAAAIAYYRYFKPRMGAED